MKWLCESCFWGKIENQAAQIGHHLSLYWSPARRKVELQRQECETWLWTNAQTAILDHYVPVCLKQSRITVLTPETRDNSFLFFLIGALLRLWEGILENEHPGLFKQDPRLSRSVKALKYTRTLHPSLMALKLDTYQIPSPWSYAGTRGPPFPTRMKAPKGRTEATVPSSTLCSSGMAPSSTSTVSSGGSGSAMTTQKGDVVATATAAVQVAGWFFFSVHLRISSSFCNKVWERHTSKLNRFSKNLQRQKFSDQLIQHDWRGAAATMMSLLLFIPFCGCCREILAPLWNQLHFDYSIRIIFCSLIL